MFSLTYPGVLRFRTAWSKARLRREMVLASDWGMGGGMGLADHTVSQDFSRAADVFEVHGLDVARVQHVYPSALQYAPCRILATIAALKQIPVDPVKTLNRWFMVCGIPPERWDDRLDVFRDLNVDIARLVELYPQILGFPANTLRAKVSALELMRLDPRKVAKRCPTAFGHTDERLRGKLTYLDSLGLGGVRVVHTYPTVLSLHETKLRATVDFVTVEMGRDVKELRQYPSCFGFSIVRRLRPRHEFARLHHRSHLSLGRLFSYSDTRFAHSMGQPLADYQQWLSNRLRRE
jgi:hypothetical protein